MRYNPKAKIDKSQVDFSSRYADYFSPGKARYRKQFDRQHPGPSGVVSIFGDGSRISQAGNKQSARYKAMAKRLKGNY